MYLNKRAKIIEHSVTEQKSMKTEDVEFKMYTCVRGVALCLVEMDLNMVVHC